MKNLQNFANQTPKNQSNRLELVKKDSKGVPRSTGQHTVKLLDSKIVMGKKFGTNINVERVRILVEEDGIKKIYEFDSKNDQGEPHYLVNILANIDDGTTVVMEAKSQNGRTFISVSEPKVEKPNDIPIIEEENQGGYSISDIIKEQEEDENYQGTSEEQW